jgi:hypothetical protein
MWLEHLHILAKWQFFKEDCGGRWTRIVEQVALTAQSPNLNPSDFFLRDRMKLKVYYDSKPETRLQLAETITKLLEVSDKNWYACSDNIQWHMICKNTET